MFVQQRLNRAPYSPLVALFTVLARSQARSGVVSMPPSAGSRHVGDRRKDERMLDEHTYLQVALTMPPLSAAR